MGILNWLAIIFVGVITAVAIEHQFRTKSSPEASINWKYGTDGWFKFSARMLEDPELPESMRAVLKSLALHLTNPQVAERTQRALKREMPPERIRALLGDELMCSIASMPEHLQIGLGIVMAYYGQTQAALVKYNGSRMGDFFKNMDDSRSLEEHLALLARLVDAIRDEEDVEPRPLMIADAGNEISA